MADRWVTLNSGHKMPLLGLGCWLTEPDEIQASVEAALEAGYRHIDTASVYMNEEGVGAGIKAYLQKTKKDRKDIFVVTKLPPNGMYPEKVELQLRKSLKKLGLTYVDLYLVHMPVGMKSKDDDDFLPTDENQKFILDYGTDHIAIWKEMERMVKIGLAKSIGVSNFSVPQMRRICAIAKIPPATNQVEMQVYLQQKELHEFCKAHNIYITAYSPLGSPGRTKVMGPPSGTVNKKQPLEDPVVGLIAERHKVSPAQVLIRYLLQLNVIVIPKSANPTRIKTNIDVWGFTLTDLEMAALQSLDEGDAGRIMNATEILNLKGHPERPH